ncbi:MAG: Zn-dependent alcohol dehydrogenase [Methylobacteriaceae bacterium]|nr:Zn-dependent alcohol dehydrogenase [Methylobacteriaceae bacterium]
MKAAVCRQFGKPLDIEDIEIADPRAGEIKVRLKACGICHSDLYCVEGAWGGTLPAVYGHEAAGIVESVGTGVDHVRPGDHVVVTLIRSCGHCPACAEGAQVFCETVFPLDRASPLTSRRGEPIVHGLKTAAFAEAVVVEASQAVAIARDVRFDSACLIACGVITGVGAAINTARVRAGESVVVIGTGGVGLNSVQGARLAGAFPIIAVDLADAKLAAARRFGATHAIDPKREDVAEKVRAYTDGRRADHVFVTVGAKAAFEQGLSLMRRNGDMIVVGMPASGITATFDPGSLANDGQRILGCKMGSARIRLDIPKIVELYKQGRLMLDELVTGRYPLDAINEAIAASSRGEGLRNVIVF